jgi:hypothetical protein
MANAYSSKRNPALQNVDRPFTEIFQLLRQLPSVSKSITSYSDDELNIANALQQHAETASQTIISGIQSLGVILATAADNQDMGLGQNDVMAIGWLLNSLGELLENCHTYSRQNT